MRHPGISFLDDEDANDSSEDEDSSLMLKGMKNWVASVYKHVNKPPKSNFDDLTFCPKDSLQEKRESMMIRIRTTVSP